jgi:hypothetical protein
MLQINEGVKKMHMFQTVDAISFSEQFGYSANDLDQVSNHLERYAKQHQQLINADDMELIRSVITNAQYLKSIMNEINRMPVDEIPEAYDFREEMTAITGIMTPVINGGNDTGSISILRMLDVDNHLKSAISKYHSRITVKSGFWGRMFMGRSS